jgi:ribose 5-phosphate isomerase A
MSDPREAEKQAAGEAAAELVQDGMAVGLGTGSTATWMIAALGRRVQAGLSIVGIPTSERSAAQARSLGIPLVTFADRSRLDLTIDGADEIARGSLNLIKGLGGALLREKLVAAASDRLVIVGDQGKLVDQLGVTPVPVEAVEFGWQTTQARIEALGGMPVLRMGPNGTPFRTDGGNLILDCAFGLIADPAALETRLKATLGVIATGLFIGMARSAYVAGPDGVRVLSSSS